MKYTGHTSYSKPQCFTLKIKCIYYISLIYILKNKLLNSQKRWGVMMWCVQYLPRVNLFITGVLIYYNGFTKDVCWHQIKSPREMTCTSDASTLRKWASDANTVPHCQLADWNRVSHTSIEGMHSYWLKPTKVTSSYAVNFHIWKPSAPGYTPPGWTHLDLI
jgi:hypothetical protein